jgi:hypothetical protein
MVGGCIRFIGPGCSARTAYQHSHPSPRQ